MITTFILYLLVIFGINYWVYKRRKKNTPEEFSLAGRKLGWLTTGLSALSTQYSAWLFLGWMGMAYSMGLSVIWLTLGVIPCVIFGWGWIAKRLRRESEKVNAITPTEYLAKKFKDKKIIIVGSLITIIFMLVYVSAQFVATGKILESMIGLNYSLGLIIGAIIVGLYVLLGGYRGDCYTDVFQGIIMIVSILALPIFAIIKIGGLGEFFNQLSVYPQLLSITGGMTGFYLLGFAILVPLGQLSMIGMPHIMKRMMSMKKESLAYKSGLMFGIPAFLLPIAGLFVGWSARILLPTLTDAEQTFPLLANELFPSVLAGLIIAGLMAAIMSSADSQLEYAGTELGKNILGKGVKAIRISIVLLVLIALLLAFKYTGLIFSLIVFGVAGLTTCFLPAIMMSFWKKVNKWGIIAGMIIAPLFTVIWRLGLKKPNLFNTVVAVPLGVLIGLITIIGVSLITNKLWKN